MANSERQEYFRPEYADWYHWIEKRRKERQWSWDKILLAGKESVRDCLIFLQSEETLDFMGHKFEDIEEWQDYVNYLRREDEDAYPITSAPLAKSDNDKVKERPVPYALHSKWQKYKRHLEEQGNLPGESIHKIEISCHDIMNRLNYGDKENGKVVHGLVMGNVQSGKTANMEGLMAMAADNGINLFIVLTGTINNLREQTQKRMVLDLQSDDPSWHFLDNPKISNPSEDPVNLTFGNGERNRYVIVCLKNSSRLANLLKWLNYDKNQKMNMKILLIDDESDQASLNTKDMKNIENDSDIERSRINELIQAIVNGNKIFRNGNVSKTKVIPYGAMNYVAYTATPYGNFLNEKGKGSLYPADFITVLSTPDTYWGPKQIFGDNVDGSTDPLPIINRITSNYGKVLSNRQTDTSDTGILEEIKEQYIQDKGSAKMLPEIPDSLKQAVIWFCIAIAIQRYRKSKKPVSMLVHHSMKTDYHGAIAKAIRQWFDQVLNEKDYLKLCHSVYAEQTKKLSRSTFCNLWKNYGYNAGLTLPDDIKNYPPFSNIEPFLMSVKKQGMNHITLAGDTEEFWDGINLCVDNCRFESVVDTQNKEPYVRLIYPTKKDYEEKRVVNAPAFLVVGGNTLARGLTLEGLVCTYFSRNVLYADSLMQMARWLGYRVGYELLPRIWLTQQAEERFEKLAELDTRLRDDIYNLNAQGKFNPLDCGPAISTCPQLVKMQITASNKMQHASSCEMNFAGAHLQTVHFQNDYDLLSKNITVANNFLRSLPSENKKLAVANRKRVWEKVPFKMIQDQLLLKSDYMLTNGIEMGEFCEWFSHMQKNFYAWDIILAGKKNTLQKWNGVGKVTRRRLLSGFYTADSKEINIGALSDPANWSANILPEIFTDDENRFMNYMSSDKNKPTDLDKKKYHQMQKKIRERAHKENVPCLVIYCIDAKGDEGRSVTTRAPLNAVADIIGIEIMIPGDRTQRKFTTSVRIK